MSTLSSDNVKIFPVTARDNHFLSEGNMTFMMRPFLLGSTGFVSSHSIVGNTLNIEFNYLGYSISLKDVNISNIEDGLYVVLNIDEDLNQIVGEDYNNEYTGLELYYKSSEVEGKNYLKLLDSNKEVPAESTFLSDIVIDGKHTTSGE